MFRFPSPKTCEKNVTMFYLVIFMAVSDSKKMDMKKEQVKTNLTSCIKTLKLNLESEEKNV